MQNILLPDINFQINKVIVGKDNRRVFVADIIYSYVEKDWLVIYHSVDEKDIIRGTFTLNLELFKAGL